MRFDVSDIGELREETMKAQSRYINITRSGPDTGAESGKTGILLYRLIVVMLV